MKKIVFFLGLLVVMFQYLVFFWLLSIDGNGYGIFSRPNIFKFSVYLGVLGTLIIACISYAKMLFTKQSTFDTKKWLSQSLLWFFISPFIMVGIAKYYTADSKAYEIKSFPDRAIEFCFQGTNWYDEWECYKNKTVDSNNCLDLTDANMQAECSITNAVKKGDISFCKSLDSSMYNNSNGYRLRHACVGLALGMPNVWTDDSFKEYLQSNSNLCSDKFSGLREDYCYYQASVFNRNKGACEYILTDWYRDDCKRI